MPIPAPTHLPGRPARVLTRLALGASWHGDWTQGVDRVGALARVLDADPGHRPISVIDTSNNYAAGRSEQLIGEATRRRGGVPDGLTIGTKLDRDPTTGSFSAERMRRSLDESRERLGLQTLPLLYLHDPELVSYAEAFASDGPGQALVAMKEPGVAESIGISGGPAPMLVRYVETGLFDAVITHNRYTLVDRSADDLITIAAERGLVVANAAVYGGGALARQPASVTSYGYRPPHPQLVTAVAAMGSACERRGVSLGASALQFSTQDQRVSTTVVGARTAEQVDAMVADANAVIPDDLFAELDTLVPPSDSWLDPPGSSWPRR